MGLPEKYHHLGNQLSNPNVEKEHSDARKSEDMKAVTDAMV